jgi:RES domain-containing protein
MIRAWHILKTKHVAHALDGEGSRLHGGRWNSRDFRVVYASQSLPLAVLEILVHLQSVVPLAAYASYEFNFDERLLEEVPDKLPPNWRTFPAPPELQQLGDDWIRSNSSAVLRVPSAVLANESNYLLNPLHKIFSKIAVKGPTPLDLDPRL